MRSGIFSRLCGLGHGRCGWWHCPGHLFQKPGHSSLSVHLLFHLFLFQPWQPPLERWMKAWHSCAARRASCKAACKPRTSVESSSPRTFSASANLATLAVLLPALRRGCGEECCASTCAALVNASPLEMQVSDRNSIPGTAPGNEATARVADEDHR